MYYFKLTIKILESYEENNHLINGVKTAEYTTQNRQGGEHDRQSPK